MRNVDAPKDQMDNEWEEFQKEIWLVNTKSEEDEEGCLECQIDKIDEQIDCYKRVELLRDKQDVVKSKPQMSQLILNHVHAVRRLGNHSLYLYIFTFSTLISIWTSTFNIVLEK